MSITVIGVIAIILLAALVVWQYRQANAKDDDLRAEQGKSNDLRERIAQLEGEREKRQAIEAALQTRKEAEASLSGALQALKKQLERVEDAYAAEGLMQTKSPPAIEAGDSEPDIRDDAPQNALPEASASQEAMLEDVIPEATTAEDTALEEVPVAEEAVPLRTLDLEAEGSNADLEQREVN